MTARLLLSVSTQPFERVRADVAIAGFFPSERPLRGAAGRADWRLCGLPSDLLADGRLREKAGEALLVPAAGRMAASRVMLLALGRRSGLNAARIHKATAAAVGRGLALGARTLALSPPVGDDPVDRHAASVLAGAVEAVVEHDADVELRLVVAPDEAASARRALEQALAADPSPAVELVDAAAGPRPGAPRGPGLTDPRPRPPAHAPAAGRSPSTGPR